MSAIAPRERSRLIGTLRLMVKSPVVGEQIAALHAVTRLLSAGGWDWDDLIVSPCARLETPVDHDDDDLAVLGRWPGGWRALATDCAKRGHGVLTEWEVTFCLNCGTIQTLSRKQGAILRRLADKLVLEGAFA